VLGFREKARPLEMKKYSAGISPFEELADAVGKKDHIGWHPFGENANLLGLNTLRFVKMVVVRQSSL
jgi:hypothetical protein